MYSFDVLFVSSLFSLPAVIYNILSTLIPPCTTITEVRDVCIKQNTKINVCYTALKKKLLRTVLKTKTNKQNCNPSLVLLMCQNWCKQSPFRMFKVIRDCQESIDWEGCESSLPQFIANSRALATKVCRNEKGIHLFI